MPNQDDTVIITALAFDPETRDWTKPVEYTARNRMEAIRWGNFNRDWVKNIQIKDE